jgi:hypothetical protein
MLLFSTPSMFNCINMLLLLLLQYSATAFHLQQNQRINRNHISTQNHISSPSQHAASTLDDAVVSTPVKFRNAQVADLEAIAILCSETFEPDFPWYQLNGRKDSISNFYKQLFQRKTEMVDGGFKHAMLVALQGTKIVGFTEVRNC